MSYITTIRRYLADLQREYNAAIRGVQGDISTADSKVKVFVIPTNEELMIAKETAELV